MARRNQRRRKGAEDDHQEPAGRERVRGGCADVEMPRRATESDEQRVETTTFHPHRIIRKGGQYLGEGMVIQAQVPSDPLALQLEQHSVQELARRADESFSKIIKEDNGLPGTQVHHPA